MTTSSPSIAALAARATALGEASPAPGHGAPIMIAWGTPHRSVAHRDMPGAARTMRLAAGVAGAAMRADIIRIENASSARCARRTMTSGRVPRSAPLA
jgi:hypothetical protein